MSYSEPCQAQTGGLFPAVFSASAWPFFLPEYDGVSRPKGIRMDNPRYPEHARNSHLSGTIMVSALVGTDGKVTQPRVVQKIDPEMDKICIDTAQNWLFEPAKAADGTPVPVRVVFELNFVLYQ